MSSPRPATAPPPAYALSTGRAFITLDGRIGEANQALAALLGDPELSLVGLAADTALAAFEPPVGPLITRAAEGGEALMDQELNEEQPASGASRRWLLSLYPVRSRLGLTLGVDLELRPWVAPSAQRPAFPPEVVAAIDRARGELDTNDGSFRSIFEQASVGLILTGPEGGLLRVNPGFCTIVGYSPAELLEARPQDLSHPDDAAAEREQLRHIMAGEPAPAIEKRFRHRDGHYVWTRVGRSLIRGRDGEVRYGLIVVQDISVEREVREALDRSEDLMRRIWDHAVFGVLVGERDGRISYVNAAFARMLGYTPDELSGGTVFWPDLTPPEHHARDAEAAVELVRTGVCPPYEKAFLARDGRRVPVLIGASRIARASDGSTVAAAFITDLTQLKAAEAERDRLLAGAQEDRRAAEAAASRAVALLSLTAALSRALTPERVAEAVIDEACGIFGAAAGAVTLLNNDQDELTLLGARGYPGELLAPWRRFPLNVATPLSDAARRGELVLIGSPEEHRGGYPNLARAYPESGTRAWAAVPLKLDQQVIGVLGLSFGEPRAFDDDDRTYLMTMAGLCAQALERARLSAAERAALDAADEALAMLDTIVDSAPIGMAFVDNEFRYRRINPALAAMNGRPVSEHLGRRAQDLFPGAYLSWEPHWRKVRDTGQPVIGHVLSVALPDGTSRHAQVSYYPVRVGYGPIVGVGVLVIDITERQEAEAERARLLASEQAARAAAQQAQADAEAALQLRDAFLSIAAHELKTPLTSLLGQAQLLERRLANEGLLTDLNARSLQVVVGQARRLSHLIGDLLDGANLELGQLAIRRRPVDLGRLVRQIVEDLQPTVPGHALTLDLPDGSTYALADPVRMEQVVQNLLSNAVKYSPRGSEVHVALRREGGRALLSVRDQGVGIPPEAVPRLFERFFRVASPETSSVSGVGVGLYVVREIVRLHGGEVHVESVFGSGSTFTVDLPLADEGPRAT